MTSKVKFVQKIIDAIYKIEAPKWYVDLMAKMQKAAWEAVVSFSQAEISLIKNKIQEVAKEDIDGKEKFQKVFDFCKAEIKAAKDSDLNQVIENMYRALKDSL
jgi:predicted AlkP superfamily phosphohydrolase/phosphomutase